MLELLESQWQRREVGLVNEKRLKCTLQQKLEAYKEKKYVTMRFKILSSLCMNDTGWRRLLADRWRDHRLRLKFD